jgi:hypothetical protein
MTDSNWKKNRKWIGPADKKYAEGSLMNTKWRNNLKKNES